MHILSKIFQKNKQTGSTFIEVLVALSIMSVALIAAISTIVAVIRAQRQSEQLVQANALAEEPLEWLRGYRNSVGWSVFYELVSSAGSDMWCVDAIPTTHSPLSFSADCNSFSLINNLYQRSVRFEVTTQNGIESVRAISTIQWEDAKEMSVEHQADYYDWAE